MRKSELLATISKLLEEHQDEEAKSLMWERRADLIQALAAHVRDVTHSRNHRQLRRIRAGGFDPRYGEPVFYTGKKSRGWPGPQPQFLFALCEGFYRREDLKTVNEMVTQMKKDGIKTMQGENWTNQTLAAALEGSAVSALIRADEMSKRRQRD